jgi:hypothetical protein
MTRGSQQLPDEHDRKRPLWRRTWVRVSVGILLLLLIVGALAGDPEEEASDRAVRGAATPTATPSPTTDPEQEARAAVAQLLADGRFAAAAERLEAVGLERAADRVLRRGARALYRQARRAMNAGRYVVAKRLAVNARNLRSTGAITALITHADTEITAAREAARMARDQRTCTGTEKGTVRAGGGVPAGCDTFAAELAARRAQKEAEQAAASQCDPNYAGACLDPNSADYDCEGGSGDGPDYTGRVEVIGDDPYDLDRDGDGVACEP